MTEAVLRLKRRSEFLRVARAGRKCAMPGLVLQVWRRPTGFRLPPALPDDMERRFRVGFTVSRKVGKAVIRNRARRRLRAAVAEVLPQHALGGHDFVVIGRVGTIDRPFSELVGDLCRALKRMDAWQDGTEGACA